MTDVKSPLMKPNLAVEEAVDSVMEVVEVTAVDVAKVEVAMVEVVVVIVEGVVLVEVEELVVPVWAMVVVDTEVEVEAEAEAEVEAMVEPTDPAADTIPILEGMQHTPRLIFSPKNRLSDK